MLNLCQSVPKLKHIQASQLSDLEKDGIVIRKVYPVVPPKVEYSLSEIGQTLKPVLEKLQAWSACYIAKIQALTL